MNIRYLKPDKNRLNSLRRQRKILGVIFLLILLASGYIIFRQFYIIHNDQNKSGGDYRAQFDKLVKNNFNDIINKIKICKATKVFCPKDSTLSMYICAKQQCFQTARRFIHLFSPIDVCFYSAA